MRKIKITKFKNTEWGQKNNTENQQNYTCKNCQTEFSGKFCPECGQSIKEFERPFSFLIVDLAGNIFAFDTRFWKTFVAILFKPGKLTLDYVKGHRVKYMPPFKFYVFISFIFFLLLNFYSSAKIKNDPKTDKTVTIFGTIGEPDSNTRDSVISDSKVKADLEKKKVEEAKKLYMNEHPDLFFKQLFTYASWAMFFLMPLYGFLLWLFYRKTQPYYITHFIMAINQHAFIFVVLTIILILAELLPNFSSSFRNYLILLLPVYFTIGHKTLYQQKVRKIILKLFTIGFIYSIILFTVAICLILLVVVQNGISL